MRAFYRKGLDGACLGRLREILIRPGIKELKLFYIISGLETAEDLDEFRAFAGEFGAARDGKAPGLRILVSAGYLVRLPRTPLQHAPLCLDRAVLEGLASSMKASCEAGGLEFRLASDFQDFAADQVLALGGAPIAGWFPMAAERGFVYDLCLSHGAWPSLEAYARSVGVLDGAFLAEKGEGYRPPLAFLSEDGATLWREYEEAKAGRDRRACLGAGCSGCGACPDREAMTAIGDHAMAAIDPALVGRLARLTAAKAAFVSIFVFVEIPLALAGATEAYTGAWLMRRLMDREEAAELAVFEARECLFSSGKRFGLPEGFHGKTAFAIFGPRRERLAGLCAKAGLEVLPSAPVAARASVEVTVDRILPGHQAVDASGNEASAGRDEEALATLRSWMAGLFVASTEKAGPEGRAFVVSERDLKKGLVYAASVWSDGEATRLVLDLGHKAALTGLLACLGQRGKTAKVRLLGWSEESPGHP